MRITDIISLLKEYILLGIGVAIFAGLAFFLGYKIIYQKVMKGQKRISKCRMLLYGISIVYAVIVFGAVFLNRGGFYGVTNLHLFSSYFEAYHKMEPSLIRNIIMNILLFVPFGFLLPHYSEQFQKIHRTVFVGFAVSLCIELIQYVTKMGILELDDLFGNTLGVWIGCGLYKTVYALKQKEKRKILLVYLLPILLSVMIYTGIYGIYQRQEFGNLSFEANYRVKVKQAEIKTEVELEQNRTTQPIYYGKILTEAETRKKAEEIFEKLGTKISEQDTDIYENTAIYYSTQREYSLWIEYRGGGYSFTDFSLFGKEKIEPQKGATKEAVIEALAKLGVLMPKTAEFKEEERQYRFTVPMHEEENRLTDGSISATYYPDGTIKQMTNHLIAYDKIAEKQVISQEEAYQEIQKGNFQYETREKGSIQSIVVQAVELKYAIDTKGYYVPYYEFTVQINGQNAAIAIKAIA